MEKVNVFYEEHVEASLIKKIDELYEDEWFGFIEDAQTYINKIFDYIDNVLPYTIHKKSSKFNSKFGDYYVYYKANKSTVWYMFFNKKLNTFIIKNVFSNHSQNAKFIN